MGSLAPPNGDSEVLLSCGNSMWPLRLAWKEKNGALFRHFVARVGSGLQTYQLTGTQPLGPDGTVREDQNEEVVCAQEEIFSTGFDSYVALPLPQIF